MKKGSKVLVFVLAIILILSLYLMADNLVTNSFNKSPYSTVDRVIDGDTLVSYGENIRLLGINTPEKGDMYYDEALGFLEGLVLDKNITIRRRGRDKYDRTLAYIFVGSLNINLEMIQHGYANPYIFEKSEFSELFYSAWDNCTENLCEKSNESCIKIDYIDTKEQLVTIRNICDKKVWITDWSIKDEGRNRFVFPIFGLIFNETASITPSDSGAYQNLFIWDSYEPITESGDTIYLWDNYGKLVDYRRIP